MSNRSRGKYRSRRRYGLECLMREAGEFIGKKKYVKFPQKFMLVWTTSNFRAAIRKARIMSNSDRLVRPVELKQ